MIEAQSDFVCAICSDYLPVQSDLRIPPKNILGP